MQAQSQPDLSQGKFFAGATALLVASVLAVNGMPGSASAASGFNAAPSFQTPAATIHEGVDWSLVAITPADPGATVGAYDR